MESEEKLILFLGSIFILCIIFEVVLLGIAYFNADEVKCNFLWCEFSTTHETIEQNRGKDNGKNT